MLWFIVIVTFIIVLFLGLLAGNEETQKTNERIKFNSKKMNDNLPSGFYKSKLLIGYKGFYIFAVDNINKKIAVLVNGNSKVIDFKDILSVEIIENGSVIDKKSATRTIGGAVVGGILAGGVGSIIGGLSGANHQKKLVSKLSVKILIKDIHSQSITIDCFDSMTMPIEKKQKADISKSFFKDIYLKGVEDATQIKDTLSIIIDEVDSQNITPDNKNFTSEKNIAVSTSDELFKLLELKEKGVLTEDEFTIQKQKILNS